MCEAFNKAFIEYRDKPIITLLEGVKFYITRKIVRFNNYVRRLRSNLNDRLHIGLGITNSPYLKSHMTFNIRKHAHAKSGTLVVFLVVMLLHACAITTILLKIMFPLIIKIPSWLPTHILSCHEPITPPTMKRTPRRSIKARNKNNDKPKSKNRLPK
ncbi:hypothetical protein CR513_13633, partial [Mucuna pruriens]